MSPLAARNLAVSKSQDRADMIRGKVVAFRASALPKAASAAENAGETVSKLALSTSKNVARALRKRTPRKSSQLAALLPISPAMRMAGRFAVRNPVIIAAAGLGLAAIGLAMWRRQHRAKTETGSAPVSSEEMAA